MAPVQPAASVAATGLGLRTVGDYAMAYSGLIAVGNSLVYLLDFSSGSGIIKAKVQFNINDSSGGERYQHEILFNGLIVQGYVSQGSTTLRGRPDTPIRLIIPPNTRVQCTSQNVQDSASRECIVSLVGRVYGAE